MKTKDILMFLLICLINTPLCGCVVETLYVVNAVATGTLVVPVAEDTYTAFGGGNKIQCEIPTGAENELQKINNLRIKLAKQDQILERWLTIALRKQGFDVSEDSLNTISIFTEEGNVMETSAFLGVENGSSKVYKLVSFEIIGAYNNKLLLANFAYNKGADVSKVSEEIANLLKNKRTKCVVASVH